jgi:hypothetical protein
MTDSTAWNCKSAWQRGIAWLTPVILILWATGDTLAQEADWKKVKEKDGIEIFNRKNDNSEFKEFVSRTVIDGTVNEFLAVLYDVEALRVWGYKIKEAELIRRDSESLQVYYAIAKAPFPYKNRDGVYLNRFRWDPLKRTLVVDIELLEDELAEKEDLVRMKGHGFWRVKELSDDRIEVEFQMQMDPGGNIPAWLSNMFSGDTPYFTIKGLKNAMKENKYKGKEYSLTK